MQPDSACADIDHAFANIPMLNFPYSETPLIGIDNLQKFLKLNDELVGEQLSVCGKPARTTKWLAIDRCWSAISEDEIAWAAIHFDGGEHGGNHFGEYSMYLQSLAEKMYEQDSF